METCSAEIYINNDYLCKCNLPDDGHREHLVIAFWDRKNGDATTVTIRWFS